MIRTSYLHRTILPCAAMLALALSSPATPAIAQVPSANQSGGGHGGTGRSGNGQPLRVMVMHDGKPVAGAHIAISVSDGSVVLRGVTRANGVFATTSLDQGIYTVTATTAKGTASGPLTIGDSTDPAVVDLTLAPKH